MKACLCVQCTSKILIFYLCNSSVTVNKSTYEPPHDKTNKLRSAQGRLRSGWASVQSDQSLLSACRKVRSLRAHKVHSKD